MTTLSSRLQSAGLPADAGQRPAPRVDPLAEAKQHVRDLLFDRYGAGLYDAGPDETTSALTALMAADIGIRLSRQERQRIMTELRDEFLGCGPVEPYLRDPAVTEIIVNGPYRISVRRGGRKYPVAASFDGEAHLRRVIDKIVAQEGRRIDQSSPLVSARLPGGSRVHAVYPPVALDGPLLTIRKFPARPLTGDDLVASGTWPPFLRDLLRCCVLARLNMVISGGTDSGKTTTLNALAAFIPEDQEVITIEDVAELHLAGANVRRLEAREPNIEGHGAITIRTLVTNALRMRPDRIIVGEVRDEAALDMLQAMNTGHDGSVTTVHANSPDAAMARIETLAMMAGERLNHQAVREQAASAIHVLVHQELFGDGTRRVTRLSQVAGMDDSGHVRVADMLRWDPAAGKLRQASPSGPLLALLADRGAPVPGNRAW